MKKNAGKRPSFQFYWKDWLSDTKLMEASKRAKGVWADLMCISCDMPETGVFRRENGALSVQNLIDLLSGKRAENTKSVNELLSRGILKTMDDGTLYVKRIYEDMKLSDIRKAAGRLGGNPLLLNQDVNQEGKNLCNQNLTPSSSSSTAYIYNENFKTKPKKYWSKQDGANHALWLAQKTPERTKK